MAFNIEISPQWDRATGMVAYTVVVTIDDHETVLTFESKEKAEAFAQAERTRLTKQETKGRVRLRTLRA